MYGHLLKIFHNNQRTATKNRKGERKDYKSPRLEYGRVCSLMGLGTVRIRAASGAEEHGVLSLIATEATGQAL